jgi:hypothetical protein
MLFLLNLVVVPTQARIALPPGLESLRSLTPEGVLKAGVQLYDKHPSLETDRPDMAQWFCTLIAEKFPSASAAIFRQRVRGKGGFEACVADVPFPTLAKLYRFQKQGDQIDLDLYQRIWASARMIA